MPRKNTDNAQSLMERLKEPDSDLEKSLAPLFADHASWRDLKGFLIRPTEDPGRFLQELFGLESPPKIVAGHPDLRGSVTVDLPPHSVQTLEFPLDWHRRYLPERHWYRRFHDLSWIAATLQRQGPKTADAAVYDYCRYFRDPAGIQVMGWDEHVLAVRVRVLAQYLIQRCSMAEPLPEGLAFEGIRALLSHLFVLADKRFYAPRHNHGLMQDIALARAASLVPGLAEATRLNQIAQDRFLKKQVQQSIDSEHIHKENSPGYQFFFLRLLNRSSLDPELGEDLRASLHQAKLDLVRSLQFFIQPDLKLAAFGDTKRFDVAAEMGKRGFRKWRQQDPEFKSIYQMLMNTARRPVAKRDTDRVFRSAGYACFRTDWRFGEAALQPDGPTCLFVKSGFHTRIHKHQDDGSFQLFGLGQELLVDAGSYANDRDIPATAEGVAASSHTLLRFENEGRLRETLRARILPGWQISDEASYVVCDHEADEGTGRPNVRRLLLFLKPFDLLVVDLFEAAEPGQRCVSQLVAHPALSQVETEEAGLGVLLRRQDRRGIFIRPNPVQNAHSLQPSAETRRWRSLGYSPAEWQVVETKALDFAHTARQGMNALAYQVRILPDPDQDVSRIPAFELSYDEGHLTVQGPSYAARIPIFARPEKPAKG
jgi:hypothetical protein